VSFAVNPPTTLEKKPVRSGGPPYQVSKRKQMFVPFWEAQARVWSIFAVIQRSRSELKVESLRLEAPVVGVTVPN